MSAFACNPAWYAQPHSPTSEVDEPADRCDLSLSLSSRIRQLEEGWVAFERNAGPAERRRYEAYRESETQKAWLSDWTLFAALKERHDQRPWFRWNKGLRRRDPGALREAVRECSRRQDFHAWVQYTLDAQARSVRAMAEENDILWLGDLPFGVALDSADVWARRELFRVDGDGRPAAVAGVPPDEYSPHGQVWNTPLFDWEALAQDGFSWWMERCRATLRWTHRLRLDHFRGYCATWEVPADSDTAAAGSWVECPGDALFAAASQSHLLPHLFAEDLGEITGDVTALRDRHDLRGMHVLQFGLEDPQSPHHPDRVRSHSLTVTGTHDSDTFNGWFDTLDAKRRERVSAVLGDLTSPARAAIETCWASPATWTMAPLQDLLELHGEARMNRPGEAEGQWSWRCAAELLSEQRCDELARVARRHGRE
jgi:4-alpha-glucanotransferase